MSLLRHTSGLLFFITLSIAKIIFFLIIHKIRFIRFIRIPSLFLFFVCISMSKFALHLHHREGDGEQVGGQAILPCISASQNRLIQTKMSRLPWGYRDEEENMYMESLPLLVFFLVQQQSIFGIHWRYDSLACFLFQFHAGIAGNFASFLRYMHVFTKCLRIAIF